MSNKKNNFEAMSALMLISHELEDSAFTVLGHYKPGFSQSLQKTSADTDRANKKTQSVSRLLKSNIKQLSDFLSASPIETLIFVAVVTIQSNQNNGVDMRDICRFFGLKGLDLLPLQKDLESLLNKRILRKRRGDFKISKSAENSILNNVPFKVSDMEAIDRYNFCQFISDLIESRDDGDIDTCDLFRMAEEEEDNNEGLEFVSKTRKLLTSIDNRIFFYEICNDFVLHPNCHTSIPETLSDIYENKRAQFRVTKSLVDGTNPILTSGLAELHPGSFASDAEISLTPKGKELFLEKDYELFEMKAGSDKRLIPADQLPDRQLFFNSELSKDLDFLKECLTGEKFAKLQERLKEANMPTGISILMYGVPGTGKTASAEMIAKATGRSVFHVDIAASKSCWFGESEKLFKRIFEDYRRMCTTEKSKPILLFNEADALFSKRKNVDTGNLTQTENALQNILLEEMEKMDGILIATTNLADNLDSAFNRRFLFKIKFGQPDKAAKQSIWKSKLAWLSDDDCIKLAANYDLSGGEIDNIVRKCEMESLLHGTRPGLTVLEEWCRQETINTGKGNTIGFAC